MDESSSDGLGNLNQRSTNLERQIRDNGVTYNVVANDGTHRALTVAVTVQDQSQSPFQPPSPLQSPA